MEDVATYLHEYKVSLLYLQRNKKPTFYSSLNIVIYFTYYKKVVL